MRSRSRRSPASARASGAALTALALVVLQQLAASHYWALFLGGTPTVGEVVSERTYETYRRGRRIEHFEIRWRTVGGPSTYTEEISRRDWERLGLESRLAVLASDDLRIAQLGTEPAISIAAIVIVGSLWGLAWVVLAATYRRRRKWWAERPVITTGDGDIDSRGAAAGDEPG